MSDLYLECNAGISGDMAVAALLDAGADRAVLQAALDSIPAQGFRVEITRVKKNGIDCADFNVILNEAHENHDHDMSYLFGHESGETSASATAEHAHGEHEHHHEHAHHHEEHEHSHDEHESGEQYEHHHHEHSHDEHEQSGQHEYHHAHAEGEHTHESDHEHHHGHAHDEHHHHHEHRNLADVLAIIDKTQMTDGARILAHKIFEIIAEAESAAHGVPLEQVHFHEVGAIDSIVDVIALAVCFDNLAPRRVFVPFLCEGSGTVRCQHGILPIPVPAVANIAARYTLPLRIINAHGEFITPTGAAFVAAVMTDTVLPQQFTVQKIGLGAGKRNYERPSIVRAMIIEDSRAEYENDKVAVPSPDGEALSSSGATRQSAAPRLFQLETNIDDCTGEALGFVLEELLAAGANDASCIPCVMKKSRPAYLLAVLCRDADIPRMEEIIFSHTTTIGIRRFVVERTALEREERTVATENGEARVKAVTLPNGEKRFYPEYESVAKIARESGKAFGSVYKEITELCGKN